MNRNLLFPINFSISCPNLPARLEQRSQFLNEIDDLFSEYQFVFVQGSEGVGKTTTLLQYGRNHHPEHSLGVFIKPSKSYATRALLLDLCVQLHVAARQKEIDYEFVAEASEEELATVINQDLNSLLYQARRSQSSYYLIVDGLHHFSQSDSAVLSRLFDILDYVQGKGEVRVLLSGDPKEIPFTVSSIEPFGTLRLTNFSIDEATRLLSNTNLSPQQVLDVYTTSKGRPSYITSIIKITQSLSPNEVEQVLNDLPEKLPQLFELRWRITEGKGDLAQLVLGILAHDQNTHTLQELSSLVDVEADYIKSLLAEFDFINISLSGQVLYESESFRKYAIRRLPYTEVQILGYLLDRLVPLASSGDEMAITRIPSYLERTHKDSDLIHLLSPSFFLQALEHRKSLAFLDLMAQMGNGAAERIQNRTAAIRFLMHLTIMNELKTAENLRSEIEVLMEMNQFSEALAVAQNAALTEDRLQLLSAIARKKREQGLEPDIFIKDEISHLFAKLDATPIGEEQALRIAFDLVYVSPRLAIELLERTMHTVKSEKSALDFALAGLSVIMQSTGEDIDSKELVNSLRTRIKDPSATRFAAHFSLILNDYEAAEILREVEGLEEIDYKLQLLRRWISNNREHNEAIDVAEYAFNLAIRTAEYPANARVFREIAAPLAFSDMHDKCIGLIQRFDGQTSIVQKLGPSEEYVRLQLTIAKAETKFDFSSAHTRIKNVLEFIQSRVSDLATKTECLGRTLAAITHLDPQLRLEEAENLHSKVEEEFLSCFEMVLISTAAHDSISKGIVTGLAKQRPELAIHCALSLNIKSRRERSLVDYIKSALRASAKEVNYGSIERALSLIETSPLRDEAIAAIVTRLKQISSRKPTNIPINSSIFSSVRTIEDPSVRSRACAQLISVFYDMGLRDAALPIDFDIYTTLRSAWEAIDVCWKKVDTGYEIVEILTSCALDQANNYLLDTKKLKERSVLHNKTHGMAYTHALRLAIRALRGLVSNDIANKEDLERLQTLIDRVPSLGEQLELWSEVALNYFVLKKTDQGREAVNKYVLRFVDDLSPQDTLYRASIIAVISPALFLTSRRITIDLISKLPRMHRNGAYAYIIEFLLWKKYPYDPVDERGVLNAGVTFNDAVEVCELVALFDIDIYIAHYMEKLINVLLELDQNKQITRSQRYDLEQRLQNIVATKLPVNDYITHDGYKILCAAYVERLKPGSASNWSQFEIPAANIPNAADAVFVMSQLAEMMPSSKNQQRKQYLENALNRTNTIPSAYDRASHYMSIAASAQKLDVVFAQQATKLAWDTAISQDTPILEPMQRRIIDFAHRFSPDLAEGLVAVIDDEPVRKRIAVKARKRLEVLKLTNDLAGTKRVELPETVRDLPEAANMWLAALNAKRLTPVHFEQTIKLLSVINQFRFQESYQILAFVIQNAVLRYAQSKETAQEIVRPLFEAALQGAELTESIAAYSFNQLNSIKRLAAHHQSGGESWVVVHPGERKTGIEFLKRWLSANANSYIKISDPYFGPRELVEILFMIAESNPNISVHILSSMEHHKKIEMEKLAATWKDSYMQFWRNHTSQSPPRTTVTLVGKKNDKKSPIHDRFWVTKGSALTIGTSFNGLGAREAQIIEVTQEHANDLEMVFDSYNPYLGSYSEGQDFDYEIFTL